MLKNKSILLIGQTASGKEKLSMQLAKDLNTEIISLDSMKIYKEMNIGTAKPSKERLKEIQHHMIDIISPTQPYSLNQYYDEANLIADKISAKGLIPYFSGGTALYAKALISGIFQLPDIPKKIREELESEWLSGKQNELYEELKLADQESTKKIHSNDKVRIIRALEVFRHTGKAISSFQNQFNQKKFPSHIKLIGLRRPRPELHERIKLRVHEMINLGLLEEVKSLLEKYGQLSQTASRAVGYQEIIQYFKGETTKEEAIERIIINTRQLCKHQMTWFRKLPIDWIDINSNSNEAETLKTALVKANSFLET